MNLRTVFVPARPEKDASTKAYENVNLFHAIIHYIVQQYRNVSPAQIIPGLQISWHFARTFVTSAAVAIRWAGASPQSSHLLGSTCLLSEAEGSWGTQALGI